MRVTGIRDLKNRLSEYVRLVARGETILVTDRDRVVAELSPPRADHGPTVGDAVLAKLARTGWLTPAASPEAPLPPRVPLAPLAEILQDLRKDRDSR